MHSLLSSRFYTYVGGYSFWDSRDSHPAASYASLPSWPAIGWLTPAYTRPIICVRAGFSIGVVERLNQSIQYTDAMI